MPNDAQVLEQARDLRGQLTELDRGEKSGIVFMEPPNPARAPTTLYSMISGEPVLLPRYMAAAVISKPNPDGPGFMFTADKANAPEYKRGKVKCFLHPESAYRASGLLEAAGVAQFICLSGNLASEYAMEDIAKGKHRKQWAAVEAYRQRQERTEDRAERKGQTDAMLSMAGQAGKRGLGRPPKTEAEE